MPPDNLFRRFDHNEETSVHTCRDHFTRIRLDLVRFHEAVNIHFRVSIKVRAKGLMGWIAMTLSTTEFLVICMLPVNNLTFLTTIGSRLACAALLKRAYLHLF